MEFINFGGVISSSQLLHLYKCSHVSDMIIQRIYTVIYYKHNDIIKVYIQFKTEQRLIGVAKMLASHVGLTNMKPQLFGHTNKILVSLNICN